MKNVLSAIVLFLPLAIISCEVDILPTPTVMTEEVDSTQISFRNVKKKWLEKGCIVDEKAGIQCTDEALGRCKKLYSCEALDSIGANVYFTPAEIAAWPVDWSNNQGFLDHMKSIGWFD